MARDLPIDVKSLGSVAALHIEVVSAMGEHLEMMQKVGMSWWWLKAELRVRWGSSQCEAGVMGIPYCSNGVILKGYRPNEEARGAHVIGRVSISTGA